MNKLKLLDTLLNYDKASNKTRKLFNLFTGREVLWMNGDDVLKVKRGKFYLKTKESRRWTLVSNESGLALVEEYTCHISTETGSLKKKIRGEI